MKKMFTNDQIKKVIEDVFSDEYLIVGETKIEYMIKENVEFDSRESDSGLNLSFVEYATSISAGIITLKEIYNFLKSLRKDIRNKMSPEEVLREISNSDKLPEKKRQQLIQKALEILQKDDNELN